MKLSFYGVLSRIKRTKKQKKISIINDNQDFK